LSINIDEFVKLFVELEYMGFRCQVLGVRNDEYRRYVSLYLRLNLGLFDPFLKEYLIVIQAILISYFIF